jgi:hypothetical protein
MLSDLGILCSLKKPSSESVLTILASDGYLAAMKSFTILTSLCIVLVPAIAHGQIFNDDFNGSSLTTNDGAGSVNPTSNTTAFFAGGDSGTLTQGSGGGADYAPGGGYGYQDMTSETGTVDSNSAYGLSSTGTDFSFTTDNVSVFQDGGGRTDIPGSENAGFRFELGIVSANAGIYDPELYGNSQGGIYVNLFYDKEGVLSGSLRITDTNKMGAGDSSGAAGIHDLSTFTIPQAMGTTTSYTNPLTVTFDLTSTGYSIGFNQTVDVSSGSLSGTFTSLEQTNLGVGVRANLYGQGWDSGDGSGDIQEFKVAVAPEPPVVYLLGLGAMAFGVFGFRRVRRIS